MHPSGGNWYIDHDQECEIAMTLLTPYYLHTCRRRRRLMDRRRYIIGTNRTMTIVGRGAMVMMMMETGRYVNQVWNEDSFYENVGSRRSPFLRSPQHIHTNNVSSTIGVIYCVLILCIHSISFINTQSIGIYFICEYGHHFRVWCASPSARPAANLSGRDQTRWNRSRHYTSTTIFNRSY